MLRRARHHAHGLRLHDALTSSPLTIVYQCIGNVKAAQLEDSLKAEVSESADGLSAVPVSFRVKNSLAIATGRPDVAAFLQATNVLVGWELIPTKPPAGPVAPAAPATRSGARTVRHAERLDQLVVSAATAAAHQEAGQGPQRQPPQRTLAALIKASLRLADKYPVAPLAGFFHGQRVGLADLARWGELDDKAVYGELVAQLGGVPYGLVDALSVGDAGVSALLDAQAGQLLGVLSARGSGGPGGGAAGESLLGAVAGA
ncbi:hypothetical protein TSOC_006181 [Tetrabaena socialis]|uniref:Uncharacterized protein n=1 Tax=Tetrabaena socialis TaxID=47790 RepID=A0A2J8A4C3_9CHLO|nr:hypothetical protein TSOC_006181 [Tetrabaena socialis]|eukprot:PNH07353.1 hypothetical protein TSOC_006181 [Tetrabaena socialis]